MSLTLYLSILWLRARAAFQKLAAQEPVRLRAALTSLVLAGAVVFPALGDRGLAESIGASAAVILPILVGESTRAKVSPSK